MSSALDELVTYKLSACTTLGHCEQSTRVCGDGPGSSCGDISPAIKCLLIDLDGTLYPIANGYEQHVRNNLWSYMHTHLGVPEGQQEKTWRPLFQKYNQSLRALRAGGFEVKEEDYWDCLRAGAEDYLKPATQVRALLESLPQEKWVFTNCNEKHATHALRLLGIEDCFKGVIGADTMGDSCKPETKAFDLAFQRCSADPRHTAMIEDSVKNLRTAKGFGMTTVLVASATMHEEGAAGSDLSSCADAVIAELTLKNLRTAAPQLWHKV